MRVLALAHQYVPVRCAGAETHLHAMLRALAARGHQVDVSLSVQTGGPYALDGVSVHPLADRKRDPFDRGLLDADLVVAHLDNALRAMCLGELNAKPTVVVQHNTFDASKRTLVTPSARVDLVVTNSEHMDADLHQWFFDRGAAPPRSIVCRPVADRAEMEVPLAARARNHATARVTLVNMRRRDDDSVARDGLSKGGEVFRALAERLPRVEFLGVTGAYGRQADVAHLPNVEVLDHVPHHGMRDQVYARTKVLLVPSTYESWGRVASEALCSSVPVIASPTPGLVEQLGDAGTFCEADDVDAWEAALVRLLDDKDEWRAKVRASARRCWELDALGSADLERWCDTAEQVAALSGAAA